MTRHELISKGGQAVRANVPLFDLYKSYLIEDYGALPDDCTGCSFQERFRKWSEMVLGNKEIPKIIINKKNNKMDYILKDSNFKIYFNNEVLSINAPVESWVEFINLAPTKADKEVRKGLFKKLPKEISTEEEKVNENALLGVELEEKKSVKTKGVKGAK